MKKRWINVWVTATGIALLYAVVYKTILTAWINPKGNAFTIKEFLLTGGEVIISIASLYTAYLLSRRHLAVASLGLKYTIILLISAVINAVLFLLYWVFFTRLFLFGLPTDQVAYLPEAWGRTLGVHLPVSLIMIIAMYSAHSREADFKLLNMEKALAETQLKNLQQQVDPHFLFNSLNILAALIKKDPDQSVIFTHHLSEMYRFFLKNQKELLVSLQEELEFLQNYFHLVTVRFGSAFRLSIRQQDTLDSGKVFIIPGTLQQLVENVIKHNVADELQPIDVRISLMDNWLTVTNEIKKKENASSGFGLNNLVQRYRLLNKDSVECREQEGAFSVRIPLIQNVSQA